MAKAIEQSSLRHAAIERGLKFIHRFGSEEKSFADYGSYLICCFALLAVTSRDPKFRQIGRVHAKQLLRRWSRIHPCLPDDASGDLLFEFLLVRYAQRRLGVRDHAGAVPLNVATNRFSTVELLGFDPRTEPPPDDLTYACDCGFQNQRSRKACKECKRRLRIRSRYRVWMEALANTYVAERTGVTFGARHADVLKWISLMRPYPAVDEVDEEILSDAIYAVTHVVYTLNDYNTHKLSPRLLPEEFAFLKANVRAADARRDSEVLGELLDSLKAFGLRATHPLIIRGTRFLLANQNEDGSWGNPDEQNIRTRCHTTWTAIDGLRAFAWRSERTNAIALKSLLATGRENND
jgi:hypothetical protein